MTSIHCVQEKRLFPPKYNSSFMKKGENWQFLNIVFHDIKHAHFWGVLETFVFWGLTNLNYGPEHLKMAGIKILAVQVSGSGAKK